MSSSEFGLCNIKSTVSRYLRIVYFQVFFYIVADLYLFKYLITKRMAYLMKDSIAHEFIGALSTQLYKSSISRGRRIYFMPDENPKVYSVVSGVFLIKNYSNGKATSFLTSGERFYASPKYREIFYIEELKQGVLVQLDLDALLEYASSKGLLNDVVKYLLEIKHPNLIYSLAVRKNAKEEVNALANIYHTEPAELKSKISVNTFIENISFLSRGTISKELSKLKDSRIEEGAN